MGGLMGLTGDPGREPLVAPALQAFQYVSLWTVIAVQAAWYRRLRTGQGARLDLSLQEAVLDISETAHTFYLCNKDVVKRNSGDHPLASPFKVFKSADGHAFIGLTSQQQWAELIRWMRDAGVDYPYLDDPDLVTLNGRVARRQEVNRAVAEWAAKVTNQELFEGGAGRGIPNAPVRGIAEVVADEQLRDRRFFVPLVWPEAGATEGCPTPGVPFRGRAGASITRRSRAPLPGEHTNLVLSEWTPAPGRWPKPAGPKQALPLEDVRVVEFCWHVAGPMVGRVLGDLGATVVKLEPREVGDPGRMLPPFPGRTPRVNGSYTFQDVNRNKLSATVNMKHPKGQALARQFAAWADVVTENFTGGTLGRLGLTYEALRAANPRLVLCSLNGYGQTGPRASWPSYHPTSAALSGLTDLFGYAGEGPSGFGHSHMDYVAGMFGAMAALDALLRRQRDGHGDHVDVSQLECGAALLGPEVLGWGLDRQTPAREGNRAGSLGAPLQGCYRCRGEDNWLVVTVPNGEAMSRLAQAIGAPPSSRGTTAGTLEAVLSAWCARREAWDAFRALQQAGVAAGVVSLGPDLAERDEHLRAREAVAWVTHPELGKAPIVQCPVVLDGARLAVRSPAPLVGQHTDRLVRDICRRSEQDYLELVVEEAV
jgi:crotonobetainyl-CoA:carnitine CoA-transferase CaiB-like acyl-CoA transferase